MTSEIATGGRLVLDTSAYSWMRTGHAGVLGRVAAAEIVILPVTALGELEAGFQLGTRPKENRDALAEFLAEPFVRTWPTSPQIARQYGEIFAHLRRRGTPIPINDVWIAATARDLSGHLLTFDEHFERVPELAATVLTPFP